MDRGKVGVTKETDDNGDCCWVIGKSIRKDSKTFDGGLHMSAEGILAWFSRQ